eukprot:TRINITY_DN2373_c0_g1_i6.p1 TRINITY_DN2373_c0_g1~~TRINITY_DN2373_c0_g1_i6.p1  ORF type:complete len:117 (+),score=29.86 TRINITY_DN2373_c0_g1_i6:161-511(+)
MCIRDRVSTQSTWVYEGDFDKNQPKGQGKWFFTNSNVVVGDYSQTLEEKETDTGDKKIEVKLGWKTKAEIVEGAEKVNTMEALQYQTSHSSSFNSCLLYTSPSPRDLSTSRMPSSA